MKFIRDMKRGILGKPDTEKVWVDILSEPNMLKACSTAKRILVAGGGHGTEVDVLVQLHGRKILKKIYFNDLFICFTNEVVLKYPDITVKQGDFTDFELYEDEDMFDVILGNPPYQDSQNKATNNKLWYKFVDKATELVKAGGLIGFVTPSSAFISTVGFGKKFCTETLKNKFSLLKVKIHGDKEYFDVGVETSHWIIQNKPNCHLDSLPVMRDTIIDDIVNKVNSASPKLVLVHENPNVTKDDLGLGTYEIYYSGKNKSTVINRPLNNGQLKVVFPFSAAYHNQFATTESTCHFNRVLYVKNQNEADNVLSYTKSKAYIFYASFYQKTSGFTPAVKNNQLPMLDSSKKWTDKEVYAHFKLTKAEIDYIENALTPKDKKKKSK